MAIVYEVSAKVGTYLNREGVEKGDYVNMGVVMETKNGGFMMKLKSIPVNWDGFAYLNTPRPRDEKPHDGGQSKHDGGQVNGDDIPF